MIDTSPKCLLMIEPSANVSAQPLIDGLTLRMAAALLKAQAAHKAAGQDGLYEQTKGQHRAASGARSDNVVWRIRSLLGSELETNSLAVHYLAWSRHEIPEAELEKLRKVLPLSFADAEDPAALALISPRGFAHPASAAHEQPSVAASLTKPDDALTLDQLLARIAARLPLGHEPELSGVRLSLRTLNVALGAAYGVAPAVVDVALTRARRGAAAEGD